MVAASAAWALGYIYQSSQAGTDRSKIQEAITALTESLDHEDGEVRRYAAYAISLIGPRAQSAIPKLTQRLNDEHMAYMAARALGEMGELSNRSIPALTALLSDSNPGARAEAALALSQLAPLPSTTISAIKRLSKDESELVRNAANEALGRLDP